MIEALIKAEKECTEQVDIKPDKVLMKVGTVFKDWADCPSSTELPFWMFWEVVGDFQSFRGRSGDKLMYERMNEIQRFWFMDVKG